MEEDNMQTTTTTEAGSKSPTNLILAVVVLIVILVAGALLLRGKPGQMMESKPAPTQENTSVMPDNAIVITDYSPGDEVVVETVVLGSSGYVVVHEDADGSPGAMLGNSGLLTAGQSDQVVIELSRDAKEGEILHVMLHSDDGNGEFDFPGPDTPVQDEEGSVVVASYLVGAGN